MSLLSRAGPCARCHAEPCPDLRKASRLPTFFFTPLCMETHTCQALSQLSTWTHGVYRQWSPPCCHFCSPAICQHPLIFTLMCTPQRCHTCPPCTHTLCTHTNVYTSHSRACLSSSHIHVYMRHHAHTPPRYLLIRSGTNTPSHAIDMLTHTQATHDS